MKRKKITSCTSEGTGLCGQPDKPNNTPRASLGTTPAHCRCCGSEMETSDCSSLGMQQLGMYILVCPTCPATQG